MLRYFFKNASYTMIANVSFAISQIIILLVINKLGNASDVGVFTLTLALVNPVFILAQSGLRSLLVVDAKNEFDFEHYFNLRTILSLFALIICISISLSKEYHWTIIILACHKFFDNLFDISYGEYQRSERMRLIAISKVNRAIFNSLSFSIAYIGSNDLNLALCFYLISSVVVFFYDFRLMEVKVSSRFKTHGLVLLKSSIPLAITAVIMSLNNSVPRILIERFSGIIEVGAFGTFMYIIAVAQIFVQSICQSLSPRLALSYLNKEFNESKRIIKILIISILFLSVAFVSFSLLFKSFIFSFLFNKDFKVYYDLYDAVIFLGPIFFISIATGTILTAKKKIKLQPVIFSFTLLIGSAFSYFLIKNHGAFGAVLSISLIYLLNSLFMMLYYHSRFK